MKLKHLVITLCFLAGIGAFASDAQAGVFGRRRCRGCSPCGTTLPRSTTVQAQIQLLQGQITDLQLRVQQLEGQR